MSGPIGVFDSGYGGLTVLKELEKTLPQYDYLYLGDNARTPYGTRSFEVVYEFTLQAVTELFNRGCHLVILACNTASAKALRNIQMNDLPQMAPEKRVLGVLRPSTEQLGHLSRTKHVGILATPGTVQSGSYTIELHKFFPELKVTEHACPMWVPLIENNRHDSFAGQLFLKEDLDSLLNEDPQIDTVALACTHYPLVKDYLTSIAPKNVQIIGQGEIVANSLKEYLDRHPDIENKCLKNGNISFLTTESATIFEEKASTFYDREIKAEKIKL
ncbi:MAG: glutamate racemase [Crocinitomicaceae bacterium]|jgi:glutamate racemase|nr:glutamate racemase [Crocinitomicaceae bacterium]